MVKRSILHEELEISRTGDELVIRGRRKHLITGVVLVCLLVPFSLAIAVQNIIGSSQSPAIWARPVGDGIACAVFVSVDLLGFCVVPIWGLVYARKRRRPWVFDLRSGELARCDQRWPLAGFTAVVVNVHHRERFFRGEWADVVLHSGEDRTLRVERFHVGPRGGLFERSLEQVTDTATDLATVIGMFLQLPARLPARENQGFEIVLPPGA